MGTGYGFSHYPKNMVYLLFLRGNFFRKTGRIYLLRSTALNLVENLNRSGPFVGSDSIFCRRPVQN